jgi:hypothetical protein
MLSPNSTQCSPSTFNRNPLIIGMLLSATPHDGPFERTMYMMSDARKNYWASKRELGFWRYVIQDGFFGYGILTPALLLVMNEWLGVVTLTTGHYPMTKLFAGWMVMGALWGAGMWAWFERDYRKMPAG